MQRNNILTRLLVVELLAIILPILLAYIISMRRWETHKSVASEISKPQEKSEPQKRPKKTVRFSEKDGEIKPVTKAAIPKGPPIPIQDIEFMPCVVSRIYKRERDIVASIILEPSFPTRGGIHVAAIKPKIRTLAGINTDASSAKVRLTAGIAAAALTPTSAVNIEKQDIVKTSVRVGKDSVKTGGLPIIKNISFAKIELMDVAQAVLPSKMARVKPLPGGEPGGCVIGRGKDIQGVFRMVRVQHNLADWWADQSALVALTKWLNTQTQIKTDMNVEGGALRLTDPKLSKAPMVFFTGHDPLHVKANNLMQGGPLRNRLSEQEIKCLRIYLIEDSGFIYFDDCGVNYASEAFVRLTLANLRRALPEYSLNRIPNNHEIYHNYYDMGGPPVGFDIFWWGTHPPKCNFLEGINVGDDLRALICRRDYMCAMESVSIPTRAVHYSPGVYRFSTNVVIYALTHGGISDYTKYVPINAIADEVSISAPTPVPSLK